MKHTINKVLQNRIEEAAEKHEQCYNVGEEHGYLYTHKGDIKEAVIYGATLALQNQWISVEEALPPYDKAVIGMDYMPELTWDDQTIIFVHRSNNPEVVTDKNKFCVYPPSFCKVTHWMPIPSLEGDEK